MSCVLTNQLGWGRRRRDEAGDSVVVVRRCREEVPGQSVSGIPDLVCVGSMCPFVVVRVQQRSMPWTPKRVVRRTVADSGSKVSV